MAAVTAGHEQQLLRELGVISDRIRALRATGAGSHGVQVKALEAESRLKWEQLRAQRAGPLAADTPPHNRRSLYN